LKPHDADLTLGEPMITGFFSQDPAVGDRQLPHLQVMENEIDRHLRLTERLCRALAHLTDPVEVMEHTAPGLHRSNLAREALGCSLADALEQPLELPINSLPCANLNIGPPGSVGRSRESRCSRRPSGESSRTRNSEWVWTLTSRPANPRITGGRDEAVRVLARVSRPPRQQKRPRTPGAAAPQRTGDRRS
jgi:hypothetical protein